MAARTLEPGLLLGKYKIVSFLARGGMGAVYKAVDTHLRRTVAIKVLRANRAQGDRDLERFNREARHSALLTHPNIVTTFDYGYDESNRVYYLVMEFIEGYDLAHHIARKKILSPKETRNILIQTAEALAHAYDLGVVHRDIKPSNFLLARVGGKVVVKLADFGLALGSNEDEFKVTRDGRTVGTIDYMAPEQARDSRAADIRSDIYSLGCTAYHMLTGTSPFAEGGIGERVHKHMHVAPTDVREYNPAVSAGLWEIVRTMLAKNPADRYTTPNDLLVDLKKVVAEATPDDAHTATLQPMKERGGRRGAKDTSSSPTRSMTTAIAIAPPTDAGGDEPTSEPEIPTPTPTPKRSRPRSKKRRTSMAPLIVGGVIVFGIAIAGVAAFAAWKQFAPTPVDPDELIAKAPPKDPHAPQKPTPVPPQGKTNPVRDPLKNNGAALPVLDLKRIDWPGRQLVPFDAVAPRGRLDDIKTVHLQGTITLASSPKLINVILTWESMARLKCQEGTFPGGGSTFVLVGNHGWLNTGTVNRSVAGDLLDYFQAFHYGTVLSNLVALNDGGFEVEKSEDEQVRKRNCFSVIVKHPDRPNVKMYFDKQTSLLCKADFQARMVDKSMVVQANATHVEIYFSNYQVIDGVNHWRRLEQWRDGQRFSELNLREIRFLKNADDTYFAIPGLDETARRALVDYRKDSVKSALAKIGAQPGTDLSRLVGGLSHADTGVSWAARDALRSYVELWRKGQASPLQSADVNALSTLALSIDDEMPWFAIDALSKLGQQAAAAAPHLVSLAQASNDPKLQARTLVALKNTAVRNDETLDLYESLIEHKDAAVKELAAMNLLQFGPERATADRLATLVGWKNQQISTEAEKHLRHRLSMVTAKDLPALKQGLRNPVRDVQLAYLDALGTLQSAGSEAAQDLVPLIKSSDKAVADQAVGALERVGKLVEFANHHADPAVVSASLAAMRRKGARDADAIAIYEKQLNHNDDRAKDTAALAMIEFAPERLTNERLVEFMSRSRPLDLAATFALYKADPAHAELRTKGTAILAMSLNPDVSDLKAFLAEPLKSKNATVLLDIGGAAAATNVVKHLLENNNPKGQVMNQKLEPTAERFMAYELLKELAKTAQTKKDRALISALQKLETSLSSTWAPIELSLTKNLNPAPEMLLLRTATAESARQAITRIQSLRAP